MDGVFTSMDISVSGLKAQRNRMNVVAQNIANINTTHDKNGNNIPFRRNKIIFAEELKGSISDPTFGGVKVLPIEKDMRAFNKRYEPDHPDADEDGNILLPNIDMSTEMVDMIEASRSYEANISAIEVAKNMINNTFEIIA